MCIGYRMYGGVPGGVACLDVMCNLLSVHVRRCTGVCALGCMKVNMLWCRYMCFLFLCQGNSE